MSAPHSCCRVLLRKLLVCAAHTIRRDCGNNGPARSVSVARPHSRLHETARRTMPLDKQQYGKWNAGLVPFYTFIFTTCQTKFRVQHIMKKDNMFEKFNPSDLIGQEVDADCRHRGQVEHHDCKLGAVALCGKPSATRYIRKSRFTKGVCRCGRVFHP